MSVLNVNPDGQSRRRASFLGRKSRQAARARMAPRLEQLEAISLMAVGVAGCPTVSGFVFLDENANSSLTNNGLFDAGETGLGTASVELVNSSGTVVGTTTTDATGFYQFGMEPIPGATTQQITQTISVPSTFTNFNGKALAPPLQLFNPELGMLEDVKVTTSEGFQSTITAENLSPIGPTTITGTVNGTFQLNGLSQPISGTPSGTTPGVTVSAFDGVQDFAGPDTVTFPAVTATNNTNNTYTDAATLGFYTASGGNTTITPTFSATGQATAQAPNGNLATSVATTAMSTVTVTYDYLPENCLAPGNYTLVQTPIYSGTPSGTLTNGKTSNTNGQVFPAPPTGTPQSIAVTITPTTVNLPNNDFAKLTSPSPTTLCTVVSVSRFGVHKQPVSFLITYNSPTPPTAADIADLTNPAFYSLTTPDRHGQFNSTGTHNVPISSITYNPATNSVTVVAAQPINLHTRVLLKVSVPCLGSTPFVTVTGGKLALLGYPHPFQNNAQQFNPLGLNLKAHANSH